MMVCKAASLSSIDGSLSAMYFPATFVVPPHAAFRYFKSSSPFPVLLVL